MFLPCYNLYKEHFTKNPSYDVISGGGLAQLKKVCNSFKNSKWMNEKCYYFHDREVQSFEEAKNICSNKFQKYGFDNGRLYEPRNYGRTIC